MILFDENKNFTPIFFPSNRYPQDKRSIWMTCKKIGSTHAELVLPLVTQLLEIHPFFDTPEPDIEDPAYLCILVLVFNAAEHCPTLSPLLDEVRLLKKDRHVFVGFKFL